MIKIEIESTDVSIKSGTSAKSGKPYSIREQKAWAYLSGEDGKPQKHPVSMLVILEEDQAPYPVGVYVLHPSSLYVAQFGRLSVGKVRLTPIAQAMKSAA